MDSMETNMPHQTRPGTDLGERFLAAWEQANGLTNVKPKYFPGITAWLSLLKVH